MKAQVLYDLREGTAWISGRDLHEYFRKIMPDGDPSPSGREEVNESALAELLKKDKELDRLLGARDFSVLTKGEKGAWEIVASEVTIEEATRISYETGAERPVLAVVAAYAQGRRTDELEVYPDAVIDPTAKERTGKYAQMYADEISERLAIYASM